MWVFNIIIHWGISVIGFRARWKSSADAHCRRQNQRYLGTYYYWMFDNILVTRILWPFDFHLQKSHYSLMTRVVVFDGYFFVFSIIIFTISARDVVGCWPSAALVQVSGVPRLYMFYNIIASCVVFKKISIQQCYDFSIWLHAFVPFKYNKMYVIIILFFFDD